MEEEIRRATVDDAEAIAAIWNQGIEERRSTFETRPRTSVEIAEGLSEIPCLVADGGGRQVTGWARLAPWSSRECYAGVGEASVYVERDARGRGLGRRLLQEMADDAEHAGTGSSSGSSSRTTRRASRCAGGPGFARWAPSSGTGAWMACGATSYWSSDCWVRRSDLSRS